MGSSLALRIGMIVIGLALIVAIYLVGTRRNKGNRRFSKDGRLRQINPIDVVAGKTEAKSTPFNTDATLDSIDGPGIIDDAFDESSYNQDKLSNPVLNELAPHPGDDIGDLPKIEKSPKGKTKRKKQSGKQISQIEMSFDDEDFAMPPPEEEETQHLLTLYVLPSGEQPFVGEFIIQALNGVGLQFGDMEIFHHFGAGKLKTETPLFSVANMVEPGSFDLKRIERFSTVGLVFFLQLPASLDGAVSFELFLNTAQRLTESLSGVLYADPKTPLDSPRIEEMRKIAAEF